MNKIILNQKMGFFKKKRISKKKWWNFNNLSRKSMILILLIKFLKVPQILIFNFRNNSKNKKITIYQKMIKILIILSNNMKIMVIKKNKIWKILLI